MSILEILEAHAPAVETVGSEMDEFGRVLDWHDQIICKCGEWPENEAAHRAHVAEVLEQHEREREAAVIECLADELAEYRNSHDVAECAAPVEGETGRQACVDRWLEITEDPEVWLREKSLAHHKNGFEYIRGIAYEAWQSGFESGWAEAKDPGAFVNDVWDAKTPNPYADEATP